MLAWIVLGLVVLGLLFLAYRTYRLMQKATGTTWQRFMAVFQHSGTVLLARIMAVISFLTGLASQAADWFGGSPEIQAAVHDVLQPKYIPWFGLVLALVIEYVRKRNMNMPAVTAPPPVPAPTVANPANPTTG